MNINELETADYDILENIRVSIYRLWKLKVFVIIFTLLSLCASLIYIGIVGVHTIYRSSAAISSVIYGSYSESTAGVTGMNMYSGLLGSTRVCDRAAEKIGNSEITGRYLRSMVNSGKITLSGASNDSKKYGYSLTLIVADTTPNYVIDITNSMASAFVDEINNMLGTSSVQVLDEATNLYTTKSINVKLYMLLFAMAGFVLSAGCIFVVEFFSGKVQSVAQCERNKDLILGIIPSTKG